MICELGYRMASFIMTLTYTGLNQRRHLTISLLDSNSTFSPFRSSFQQGFSTYIPFKSILERIRYVKINVCVEISSKLTSSAEPKMNSVGRGEHVIQFNFINITAAQNHEKRTVYKNLYANK